MKPLPEKLTGTFAVAAAMTTLFLALTGIFLNWNNRMEDKINNVEMQVLGLREELHVFIARQNRGVMLDDTRTASKDH